MESAYDFHPSSWLLSILKELLPLDIVGDGPFAGFT